MKIFIKIIILIICFLPSVAVHAAAKDYFKFAENKGQWDSSVLYYANSGNYDIWITGDRFVFDYYQSETIRVPSVNTMSPGRTVKAVRNGHIISMNLLNSKSFYSIKKGKSAEYFNYFIGSDVNNWASDVHMYQEIFLKEVYQGVDMRLYYEENDFRYDFELAPGASADDIKINFDGADSIFSHNEELCIATSMGIVRHRGLRAYQNLNGAETDVECSWEISDGVVSFTTAEYNKDYPLIIDPMVFSTFLGGANFDMGEDMTVDNDGFIYVTGYTQSSTFPVTEGAFNEYIYQGKNNFPDIFVSKFTPMGDSLVFSTFIGGWLDDYGRSIDIDFDKNIYVTGEAGPTNSFPLTSGVYDSTINGGFDVFVLKLTPDGTQLIYSTVIGSQKDDYAQSIITDKYRNTLITGFTKHDGDFPKTPGAFQSENHGEYDAFVAKLDNKAETLIFSTYIGGGADDFGEDITLDAEGNVLLTGFTSSLDFPVTADAMFPVYNDTNTLKPNSDIFLSKLNGDDGTLIYSSFLGGRARDGAYSIATDDSGYVYIGGFSESRDYPVTDNAYDNSYNSRGTSNGAGDIVITKLSSDMKEIIYSTFIGGVGTERAYDIAVADDRSLYATGTTGSTDFPITNHAVDKTYNDVELGSDAFIIKLNPSGDSLNYSSYLGGSKYDIANAVFHLDEYVYLTGTTSSRDFPVTSNAYDFVYNDTTDTAKSDVFIAMLLPIYLNVDIGVSSMNICDGDTVTIGNYASGNLSNFEYSWEPEDGIESPHSAVTRAYPKTSATYTLTVTDIQGYQASDTIKIDVLDTPKAKIFGPQLVIKDSEYSYSSFYVPGNTYFWYVTGGEIIQGDSTHRVLVKWTDTTDNFISLEVANLAGCSRRDSMFIIVGETFKPVITPLGPTKICDGDSTILDAGDGYTLYYWSDGSKNRYDTVRKTNYYWVMVRDSRGRTGYSDTITVLVYPLPPKPKITYQDSKLICISEDAKAYQWYLNGVPISDEDTSFVTDFTDGDYQVEILGNSGCKSLSDKFNIPWDDVPEPWFSSEYLLYPNPAENVIFIRLPHSNSYSLNFNSLDITVCNLLGNVVQNEYYSLESTPNSTLRIDLNELPAGLYYVQIKTEYGTHTEKFILY